jgi:stage IV sporulation protein FB
MRVRISRRAAALVTGAILAGGITALSGREAVGELSLREAVTILLAGILHELGHVAAAWGWTVPIRALRLELFGARMEMGGLTGYAAELAVASGGPFISLAMAAIAYPMGDSWESAALFSSVSLGVGLLNLLPVSGLDGGRMLSCALSLTVGERAAGSVLRLSTGLTLGCLWLLSVYALLRLSEMLTLFAFTLCLLLKLTDNRI